MKNTRLNCPVRGNKKQQVNFNKYVEINKMAGKEILSVSTSFVAQPLDGYSYGYVKMNPRQAKKFAKRVSS